MNPNVTSGDAILTLNITAKPPRSAADIQICAWNYNNGVNFADGFTETCSTKTGFTDETAGAVTINLGPPDQWWQLNDFFPWTQGPDIMRLMFKDAVTQTLLMSSICGTSCWAGTGPLAPHVPITMTASLTFNN